VPHGYADIGRFQGRSIADPIAGHGYHPAAHLQGFHNSQLVRRAHPAIGMSLGCQRLQHFMAELIQFRRVHDDHRFIPAQIELLGNRIGGRALIAGDHDGLDSRLVEDFDELVNAFSNRVRHTDQSQPDQVVLALFGFRVGIGDAQDPQRPAGHALVCHLDCQAIILTERYYIATALLPLA